MSEKGGRNLAQRSGEHVSSNLLTRSSQESIGSSLKILPEREQRAFDAEIPCDANPFRGSAREIKKTIPRQEFPEYLADERAGFPFRPRLDYTSEKKAEKNRREKSRKRGVLPSAENEKETRETLSPAGMNNSVRTRIVGRAHVLSLPAYVQEAKGVPGMKSSSWTAVISANDAQSMPCDERHRVKCPLSSGDQSAYHFNPYSDNVSPRMDYEFPCNGSRNGTEITVLVVRLFS